MPFVPENPIIFTAAYSGALAGMAASGRYVQSVNEATFTSLAAVAGAFAQAFDEAWGTTSTPSQLEVQAVEAACEGTLEDRQPILTGSSLESSTWLNVADAIVAVVRAGDAYFTSQGIVSPIWPSGSSLTFSADLLGSTPSAQWVHAISGEGGLGGTVSVGQNVTLEMGSGAPVGSGGELTGVAIRFRSIDNTPGNFGYPMMVIRDIDSTNDVMVMNAVNSNTATPTIDFGINDAETPDAFRFWSIVGYNLNVADGSANTNSSGVTRIAGPGGSQFTVYSEVWSYAFQQAELLESPAQWRIEYASTGPTSHNIGPGAITLAQFAPPDEDCVMTLDVILTGRQIGTTDFTAWRMQGSWRVSPGTPPTLTPGTSEPTAVLISNTAGAVGVNPVWVLLGDGFASIQGTPWTFTSDIAWKALATPEDINDVQDVTFALSPAPAWGIL